MQKKFPALRNPLARAVATLGFALSVQSVLAQNLQFDIPAQPLSAALASFGRQSGLQLAFSPDLVQGKQGRQVSGQRDARAALNEMLSGTGLHGQLEGRTMVIQPVPTPLSAATLPAITVTSEAESSSTTEQTGSYTSRALTIGKMEQSIRETPQSVTVVTRQQMDDQNLTSVDRVLAQTTGTTASQRNFGAHTFSIRGYALVDTNYLVDGVPATVASPTGWAPLDTAVFDRVEILRGASVLGPMQS